MNKESMEEYFSVQNLGLIRLKRNNSKIIVEDCNEVFKDLLKVEKNLKNYTLTRIYNITNQKWIDKLRQKIKHYFESGELSNEISYQNKILELNLLKTEKDNIMISLKFHHVTKDNFMKNDLKFLFNQSDRLICKLDLNYRINSLNKAWFRHLGYSPKDIRNMNFLDFVAGNYRYQTKKKLQRLFSLDNKVKLDNQIYDNFGNKIPISWNFFKFETYIIASGKNINQLRKAQFESFAKSRILDQVGD